MKVHFFFAACLAFRAQAIAISTPQNNVVYGEVNSALEQNMELMSQYASAAYCIKNHVLNDADILCPDEICPITIAVRTVSLLTNENGFIAIDSTNKLIVMSLVGSVSVRNWETDLNFPQLPCIFGIGCLVHSGFHLAWLEIKAAFMFAIQKAQQQNPDYKLVVTGHSLGAAVATVAAASLRVLGYPCDLFTFGSPRVFNSVGAAFVSNQPGGNIRVTHYDDPVPRLPPLLLNYRHTSPEYWLPLGNATRVDYDPSQIAVCPGDANLNCNAKFTDFDALAHDFYFQWTTECAANDSLPY